MRLTILVATPAHVLLDTTGITVKMVMLYMYNRMQLYYDCLFAAWLSEETFTGVQSQLDTLSVDVRFMHCHHTFYSFELVNGAYCGHHEVRTPCSRSRVSTFRGSAVALRPLVLATTWRSILCEEVLRDISASTSAQGSASIKRMKCTECNCSRKISCCIDCKYALLHNFGGLLQFV